MTRSLVAEGRRETGRALNRQTHGCQLTREPPRRSPGTGIHTRAGPGCRRPLRAHSILRREVPPASPAAAREIGRDTIRHERAHRPDAAAPGPREGAPGAPPACGPGRQADTGPDRAGWSCHCANRRKSGAPGYCYRVRRPLPRSGCFRKRPSPRLLRLVHARAAAQVGHDPPDGPLSQTEPRGDLDGRQTLRPSGRGRSGDPRVQVLAGE